MGSPSLLPKGEEEVWAHLHQLHHAPVELRQLGAGSGSCWGLWKMLWVGTTIQSLPRPQRVGLGGLQPTSASSSSSPRTLPQRAARHPAVRAPTSMHSLFPHAVPRHHGAGDLERAAPGGGHSLARGFCCLTPAPDPMNRSRKHCQGCPALLLA